MLSFSSDPDFLGNRSARLLLLKSDAIRRQTGEVARQKRGWKINHLQTIENMLKRFKTIYGLIRDTVRACINGDIVTKGAALSYYTFFAIAPLFVIALAIAGFWFGEEAARGQLFSELNQLVGKEGGEAIQAIVAAASKSKAGFWATAIAVAALFVAATGMFVQLQDSLNSFWNVRQKPGQGLRYFIRHRLLSFAMVLGIGFLLLVSLVLSAGMAMIGNFLGDYITGKEILLKTLNFLVSLGVITALFASIFKFLPDVKIGWRAVWLGGFITAVLFNVGKLLFGIYIGRSSVASVYGAMGSLVIVLLWVYYSAQILFFGAQFTRLYADRCGVKPHPVPGSEFVPTVVEDRPKRMAK
jgi:membrane protein